MRLPNKKRGRGKCVLQVITCFQMFLGTFRSFAAMRQANSIAYYFYWYTYMVLFRDLAKKVSFGIFQKS